MPFICFFFFSPLFPIIFCLGLLFQRFFGLCDLALSLSLYMPGLCAHAGVVVGRVCAVLCMNIMNVVDSGGSKFMKHPSALSSPLFPCTTQAQVAGFDRLGVQFNADYDAGTIGCTDGDSKL